MRKYEVMVIIDPDTDDRQVNPLLEQYTKVITEAGGTVESVDVWGKRRLAYEIQKKTEGIYAVIDLTASPEAVQEMDRLFGINEQVMRTKVLRPGAH